jgi:hypothetical protein
MSENLRRHGLPEAQDAPKVRLKNTEIVAIEKIIRQEMSVIRGEIRTSLWQTTTVSLAVLLIGLITTLLLLR